MAGSSPFTAQQIFQAAKQFPTPFYLYDEGALRKRVRELQEAFAWNGGYRQYFAVKALPNPEVLKIMAEEGCGADCASATELTLASLAGLTGDAVMFTSNNTPASEYRAAEELGAIINLDSLDMVDALAAAAGIPETICVRYSPDHPIGSENAIMGDVQESKFGMRRDQVFAALAKLRDLGAQRFGIHSMAASNSLDESYYPSLAEELFQLALEVRERLGIDLSFLNFGGGLGIPYEPGQRRLDLAKVGEAVRVRYDSILTPAGLAPAIYTESGRYVSGPAGVLVTRVRHLKESYKRYVGVDASATDLLRPAMYGSYHHVTVAGKEDEAPAITADVVGSLCENNDKFAVDRELPDVEVGDLLVVHDAGAHGYAMGYNYNGKLRGGEILWQEDGTPRMIRRPETAEDYFATLRF